MIVQVSKNDGETLERIIKIAKENGVRANVSEGDIMYVVGLEGDTSGIELESLRGLPHVIDAWRISNFYKIIAREVRNGEKDKVYKKPPITVNVNGRIFGGEKPIYTGGPCAVESKEQLMEIATGLKEIGGELGILDRMVLRGGAYKPRSNAYSFRGLGEKALGYLCEAREKTGMPFVTEIMDPRHVELFEKYGVDMYQVGARNWQDQALLVELGKLNKPVLYKRGMFAELEEWLGMAEFIAKEGNKNIVLCERGISNRLSGDYHRNHIDFDAIAAVRERCILPIIVDPSHGTGVASQVPIASKAAINVYNADGLIIEVLADKTDIGTVKCDGAQSIRLSTYKNLLRELK